MQPGLVWSSSGHWLSPSLVRLLKFLACGGGVAVELADRQASWPVPWPPDPQSRLGIQDGYRFLANPASPTPLRPRQMQ